MQRVESPLAGKNLGITLDKKQYMKLNKHSEIGELDEQHEQDFSTDIAPVRLAKAITIEFDQVDQDSCVGS